jgi:uroporphyrin-III C-methyltransferase
MKAKLTLVGAGPGDPDLITVKGINALAAADVVLYDALVHPHLLQYAPGRSRKVYVGKRAGKHGHTQAEINELIVRYAFDFGHVVRLKGGDPFVFARGREELDHAGSYGIPTEVIPGISSINLAGMYGFPLTLRGVSESFWVVTATTQSGKLSEDLRHVAASSATAVVLMGMNKLQEITRLYQELGKGNLPVVIISKGSLPDARIIYSRVDNLLEEVQRQSPPSPGILLIGEAVACPAAKVVALNLLNHE